MESELLAGLQGRWQNADGDVIVVENDLIWFLGDSVSFGKASVKSGSAPGTSQITLAYIDGSEPDIIGELVNSEIKWGDGDAWNKIDFSDQEQDGLVISPVQNPESDTHRRWTKDGQLGSKNDSPDMESPKRATDVAADKTKKHLKMQGDGEVTDLPMSPTGCRQIKLDAAGER